MAGLGDFGGNDRFTVHGRLGAGGFGVVYKVLDRERDAFVALKTLRHVAPEALYRFKQEFRALADVSHPNLVTLYELSSDGQQLFFTMELVDGMNFLAYVRHAAAPERAGSSGTPLSVAPTSPTSAGLADLLSGPAAESGEAPACGPDLERLRGALPQLARGVCALHEAGKLHRDIKPSNVLVTRQGRVALLDFGLVKELDLAETHTQEAVGTPAYMSPEQAAGLPLTEKSDWYSVGCMLYEALTGRLPFRGRILDVLREKQEHDPPPPIELAPATPLDLGALCLELLQRNADRRPTGAEVLKRLEGVPAAPPAPAPRASAEAAAPFVGRSRELQILQEAFETMTRGQTVTVGVQGGSGMGKSALVRRFLDRLARDNDQAVIVSGRCHERETVPFKALDALIDALSQQLRRLPSSQVEALLPHDVPALVRLFPVLRQVGAVARSRRAALEIPDSQELRRRAFTALRELLVRMADRRPLVLFIDDIQWGDADSAVLLEALLRPPEPPTLLLLACFRSEEAETSPLLRVVLPLRQNVAGSDLVRRDIVLRELTPAEARALACSLLGADDAEPPAMAEVIARESGGNPYFIEEQVRFAQAARRGPLLSSNAPDVTLSEVIEARVSHLSEDERRLLDVVALAGQPIESGVAYRAAELDQEGPSVLAALRAAHLVRTRATALRNEIEAYHDRIRNAVVAGLDPGAIKECHQRLALALLASGRADPEMLAVHFQGAGDMRSAAEYATAAAVKASEALAFDRAASLYGSALAWRAAAGLDEGDLRIKLGDALSNAGRGAEAAEAYLSASKGAGEALAVDLHRRAAYQFLIAGHIEDGRRAVNTVLSKLGMSFPRTPRAALLSLLAGRALLRLRGLGFTERDETRVPPQELLRIDTCWSVAVGVSQFDMLRGADFQARSLLRALRAGEPYRVARALALESTYAAMGGSRTQRRTQRLLGVAKQLAERVGNPHAVSLQTLFAGTAAWLEGRWKDSLGLCERAEGLLRERCSGVIWEIMSAQMFQLGALFFLGELKELQRRLPALVKEAEQRGSIVSTFLRIGYCFHMAWLAADDPATARQELESGLQGWSGQFDYLHMWAHGARTDIAIYAGELEQLPPRLADKWRPVARALDRFVQVGFVRGLDARARRSLAEAARAESPEQREALLRRAEKNARAIRRQRTHWGEPLALLLEAGAAATRGNVRAAGGLLENAEAGFRAADMALHAAVASRRRGQILSGDAGQQRVAAADAWMAAQDVVNPARLSSLLAPGLWPGR